MIFQVKKDAWLTFDVRLGYRNDWDPPGEWREIAHSTEVRPLSCVLNSDSHSSPSSKDEFKFYDCEVLPLFTLGSCHHQNYLVNIRIPRDIDNKVNHEIGLLQDVWMVEIHQNGGFTMVSHVYWLSIFSIHHNIGRLSFANSAV